MGGWTEGCFSLFWRLLACHRRYPGPALQSLRLPFGSSAHPCIVHPASCCICYKTSLVSRMVELYVRSAVGGLLSNYSVSPSFVWSTTMTNLCFSLSSFRVGRSFLLLTFVRIVLQNVYRLLQVVLCCLRF